MASVDIFGIDSMVVQAGVLGEYATGGEVRIRFVIENALPANTVSVYGKVKGQTAWSLINTFNGNSSQNLTVSQFDYLLVVFDNYAPYTNFVHFLASGIAQTSGGIATINAGGNTLEGLDALKFESTDGSVIITSDVNNGSINLRVTGGISGVATVTETFTLTNTNITNKSVTLLGTPVISADVRLSPINGVEQVYGTDFTISGTTLSWSGLGFEALAEAGDIIIISYI